MAFLVAFDLRLTFSETSHENQKKNYDLKKSGDVSKIMVYPEVTLLETTKQTLQKINPTNQINDFFDRSLF